MGTNVGICFGTKVAKNVYRIFLTKHQVCLLDCAFKTVELCQWNEKWVSVEPNCVKWFVQKIVFICLEVSINYVLWNISPINGSFSFTPSIKIIIEPTNLNCFCPIWSSGPPSSWGCDVVGRWCCWDNVIHSNTEVLRTPLTVSGVCVCECVCDYLDPQPIARITLRGKWTEWVHLVLAEPGLRSTL